MKTLVRLLILLLLVEVLLVACIGGTPTIGTPNEKQSQPQETDQVDLKITGSEEPSQSKKEHPSGENFVEIFSWWTAGGELKSLNALTGVFEAQYPDVEVFNGAAAVDNDKDPRVELAARMQEGDPPDSFQVRAGRRLTDSWVAVGFMEPVTLLFKQNDWVGVYPSSMIDLLSYDGEIWSVPVNVQRSNVLWYNKEIFDKYTLEPPASLDDFFSTAEKLQEQGIPPLTIAGKDQWALTYLFENVLLATLGPEAYRGLWTGDTSWNSPQITKALNDFARMLDYADGTRADLSWEQAAQQVANGGAAMTIMVDWADAYFLSLGFVPGEEIGWAPSPGTGGSFMLFSDSFSLPTGALHRDNAMAWLTVVGSLEGQDSFNPSFGSIPSRTDSDRSLYSTYIRSAMDDYARDEIVPSVAHGTAASVGWVAAIGDVLLIFTQNSDVQAAQQYLVQACQGAGVCKTE